MFHVTLNEELVGLSTVSPVGVGGICVVGPLSQLQTWATRPDNALAITAKRKIAPVLSSARKRVTIIIAPQG